MSGEPMRLSQMPLWALIVLVLLFCVAAFSYGIELGRDLALSRAELAVNIDHYTKPALFGSLIGIFGLCIWLTTRGNRAEQSETADRTRK